MCSRLASIEKGASPRLSLVDRDLVLLGVVESFVREVRSHSRHGAITLMSGSSA